MKISKTQLLPTKFPQANKCLTKPIDMTDEECSSLWVYNNGVECISCWKLSLWQRLMVLIHGRVWLGVHSGITQPPVWLDCDKTVFIKPKKEAKR